MDNETIFRIAFIATFTGLAVVRVYYRRKTAQVAQRDKNREPILMAGLRSFVGLGGVALLVIYLFWPDRLAWSYMALPDWFRWIGVVVGPLAVALIAWTHIALGANYSPLLQIEAEHHVVSSGPFRWVRHPMYVGIMLLVMAFFLLLASWLIGLIYVAGGLWLLGRVGQEEAMLITQFGDEYRAYMGRTGRFVPRLSRSIANLKE